MRFIKVITVLSHSPDYVTLPQAYLAYLDYFFSRSLLFLILLKNTLSGGFRLYLKRRNAYLRLVVEPFSTLGDLAADCLYF